MEYSSRADLLAAKLYGGLSAHPDKFRIPADTRNISADVLDADGQMRILPAGFWHLTTRNERALFGHLHGIYAFPTVELVERLREIIGDREAIEIGAGNGVLAAALNIRATDNRHQEREPHRSHYRRTGQAIVPYGPNVIECDAKQAVRRYDPQVVIGCWVTHAFDVRRPLAGGNEMGVNELDVLRHCETYVVVGNEQVHKDKAIWDQPHTVEYPPYVYSRAHNGSRDFIAVWPGRRRPRGKR